MIEKIYNPICYFCYPLIIDTLPRILCDSIILYCVDLYLMMTSYQIWEKFIKSTITSFLIGSNKKSNKNQQKRYSKINKLNLETFMCFSPNLPRSCSFKWLFILSSQKEAIVCKLGGNFICWPIFSIKTDT